MTAARRLSSASVDGPDPTLKAHKAADRSKPDPASSSRRSLRSARKRVRVVDQAEESNVDETKTTKGTQKDEVLNSLTKTTLEPRKSALKLKGTLKSKNGVEEQVVTELEQVELNDEEDSSNDEHEDWGDAELAEPIDSLELPVVDEKGRQPKLDKANKTKSIPGVVILSRIPHGFHEPEMRAYFSQFGQVNRLRLSRSKRTGHSKHYAFIEFEHVEVAQIVVETMNNYLLSGRLLQCSILPKESVHSKLWIGHKRKYQAGQSSRVAREKHNEEKTEEQQSTITTRLVRRENAKRKRIEEMGIEYEFPGYAGMATTKKPKTKAATKRKSLDDTQPKPLKGKTRRST